MRAPLRQRNPLPLQLAAGWLFIVISGCQQNTPSIAPAAPEAAVAPEATAAPDGEVAVNAEPAAASEKTSGSPPPEATIKALLEKDMWGPPEQGGTVHTYNYKSLKVADGRQGNYLTDGVPANSDTTVYPVKVQVEITRTFTDGTSKQEKKDQSYVFFQDEFGDWTYRFIQNN
jgi:hypothetical protein